MLLGHLKTRLDRIDDSLDLLENFANGDWSFSEDAMMFRSVISTIVDASQKGKEYIRRKEFADWLKKHPEILG